MSTQSWYNHPVIALAGAFGAGAAFALTAAIPLYNTSAQNACDDKVRQVEEKYAHDKADLANMAELRKENVFYRAKLTEARIEVWQLSDKKPFRSGSPVPVGLEAVQVGMKVDDVEAILKQKGDGSAKGYYYFHLRGGLIDHLQIRVSGGIVKDISYYVNDDDKSKERLMGAVSQAFGPPASTINTEDGATLFQWKVGDKQVTLLGNQYSIGDQIR